MDRIDALATKHRFDLLEHFSQLGEGAAQSDMEPGSLDLLVPHGNEPLEGDRRNLVVRQAACERVIFAHAKALRGQPAKDGAMPLGKIVLDKGQFSIIEQIPLNPVPRLMVGGRVRVIPAIVERNDDEILAKHLSGIVVPADRPGQSHAAGIGSGVHVVLILRGTALFDRDLILEAHAGSLARRALDDLGQL